MRENRMVAIRREGDEVALPPSPGGDVLSLSVLSLGSLEGLGEGEGRVELVVDDEVGDEEATKGAHGLQASSLQTSSPAGVPPGFLVRQIASSWQASTAAEVKSGRIEFGKHPPTATPPLKKMEAHE